MNETAIIELARAKFQNPTLVFSDLAIYERPVDACLGRHEDQVTGKLCAGVHVNIRTRLDNRRKL